MFIYLADAVKRKNLPAWIREGLEKMERDKQKKKEEEERRKKQLERKRPLWAEDDENDDENNENLAGSGRAKGVADSGDANSQGGQAESDEELPDDEEAIKESDVADGRVSTDGGDNSFGSSRKKAASPPPIFLTPEEKEQQFALNVKRFMTEILIAVLTEELDEIAVEEIRRARTRVTAKPKKVTSALANIVGISKSI